MPVVRGAEVGAEPKPEPPDEFVPASIAGSVAFRRRCASALGPLNSPEGGACRLRQVAVKTAHCEEIDGDVMSEAVKGPASYFPAIEKKYGRPVAEWKKLIRSSPLTRHMELVTWLKTEHGMGHGHANALVAHTLAEDSRG